MERIETDYLVVGAGAVGMSFTDSLAQHSTADVVLVDRRHRPGGHWNDAYPFVRLHVPSANYGVDSVRLGSDAVDDHGPNAGMYELAGAAEICAYFDSVLDRLETTGRVRFVGMHEYEAADPGRPQLVSRLTGETVEVTVRRKVVDATYLQAQVPSRHTPSFTVGPDARVVPVNGLVEPTEPASQYVVLGAGKTGIDACLWLLDHGVAPERIQWVRPRDMWLLDRARFQPLAQVGSIMEGHSLEVEALASASSVDDLFRRLEECGQLLRIDEQVEPTMFRCATVSRQELDELRRITDVVRLGHVLRIERDRLVLERGEVPTGPGTVHVDCTAEGIPTTGSRPVFEPGRITVQPVRLCVPCFNAALIGYVEATRDDDDEKNRLCPPNPYPDTALDWLRTFATSRVAERQWSRQPDVQAWVDGSRLNLMRGVMEQAAEIRVARAFERYGANVEAAMTSLPRLMAEADALRIPAPRAAPAPIGRPAGG
jgi:hypothetical protein